MISLITITAREDPMLAPMAASIATNINHIDFEWIIVDAQLWHQGAVRRGQVLRWIEPSGLEEFAHHIPPKPSAWHGPLRKEPYPLPDQNGARNTGILHALGDYLVFLDDCSVLSPDFLKVAHHAAEINRVIRYPFAYDYDDGQPITVPMPVRPYPIDPTGMRGSGVGFPLEALLRANGWDEAYSGERKEDLELGIRVSRLGYVLMMLPGAWLVEKKAGQERILPAGCDRNDRLLAQLLVDEKRTQPIGNDFSLRDLRGT